MADLSVVVAIVPVQKKRRPGASISLKLVSSAHIHSEHALRWREIMSTDVAFTSTYSLPTFCGLLDRREPQLLHTEAHIFANVHVQTLSWAMADANIDSKQRQQGQHIL